jgi:6-pyruvoyltetrahydropterin/6-carboxytetrahydropterin synthase
MKYTATRIIGIDMGHRVMTHGSKCKSLHGHRYQIEATVEADVLQTEGVQTGMVMDFGFLKDLMMDTIDRLCDHGMIMYDNDPLLFTVYPECQSAVLSQGVHLTTSNYLHFSTCEAGKLTVVGFIPTAENLARWWFELLQQKSPLGIQMKSIKVWETPNCYSIYPA